MNAHTTQYGKSLSHRGVYFLEEASAKGLIFLSGKVDDIKVFWLVDPDGLTIESAKFFSYGGQNSNALGEAFCILSEGVHLQQGLSITGSQVISHLAESNYFPFDSSKSAAQVDRLVKALCEDFPIAKAKLSLALSLKTSAETEKRSAGDQQWLTLSKQDQIKSIETAIDLQVREALEMDGGGIEITDIKNDWDVYAEFKGACTSCSASLGSTFIVVENIIKTKVNERLRLVVNSFPW